MRKQKMRYTLKEYAKTRPEMVTESSLRWEVHNGHQNGLFESGACMKVNGRIIFDDEKYLAYQESRNEFKKAD
jgi:hypothetical protein